MTTGTEGDDELSNDPQVDPETVDALGGDDTITIVDGPNGMADMSVTVHGGAGTDTLIVDGLQMTSNPSGTGSGTISYQAHEFVYMTITFDGIERLILTGEVLGYTLTTGDTEDHLTITRTFRHGTVIATGGNNDTVTVTSYYDTTVHGDDGNDILTGGESLGYFLNYRNTLYGDAGDDTLAGGAGPDQLYGGTGTDSMDGGIGDDASYVDDAGDTLVERANEGFDTAYVSVGWTLTAGAHVERIVTSGVASLVHGNELDNEIIGHEIVNHLYGEGGNDSLAGGGSGDLLFGGTGDDAYWIIDNQDQIFESAGEGTDKVLSTIDYTLIANLENLELLGTALVGRGNELNNIITGNAGDNALYGIAGNDRLDGRAGADRLSGGDGNDTYFVDDAGDRALEASATGGLDTVYSSVTFNLAGQQIERLFLTGLGKIDAIGNSLDNTLTGNGNHNLLDGGRGVDVMNGGGGNDTYIVDETGDRVIEGAGGGTDTIRSSATYRLSDAYQVETLVMTGTAAINAYGNQFANRLDGNANNNILSGGGGDDRMYGGDGNDTYYVDSSGDMVVESSVTGGIDGVYSSATFSLAGQQVENLFLTGSAAIDATGNSLVNRLYGNGAANTLNGGGAADFMNGGGGNDVYWVDHAGDRVVEGAGGGTDTINSSVSFDLAGIHAETLILTGSAALTGTGNSLANRIVGNSGTDTLLGLGGDDVLEGRGNFHGGTGDDTLISLTDEDLFYFDTALDPATNVDTIQDFDTVGFDQIQLSRAIFTQVDAGILSEDAFHTGTAAADAEDRIVYDNATGRIWYDADGTGGGAAILFAQVEAGTPLTNIHFFGY